MNIPPELEAKIVHAANCQCAGCRNKMLAPNVEEGISEKLFLAEVRALLNRAGWRSYHTHNSRKSDAGFPDLVAVREGRVLWIELKTEKGIVSAAQLNWIEDLKAANQEVFLWRPSDWKAIVATLT